MTEQESTELEEALQGRPKVPRTPLEGTLSQKVGEPFVYMRYVLMLELKSDVLMIGFIVKLAPMLTWRELSYFLLICVEIVSIS